MKYDTETVKPCGNWGDSMRLSKLPSITAWERARDRYFAICAKLDRRKKEEI